MTYEFQRSSRLLSFKDYSLVMNSPTRITVKLSEFRIIASLGLYNQSKLGFIISKRFLKLSVHRNRVKRVARDIFRQDKAAYINSGVVLHLVSPIKDLSDLRQKLELLFSSIKDRLNSESLK